MDDATRQLLYDASRTCMDIDFSIVGLNESIFLDAPTVQDGVNWLMVVLGQTLSRAFQIQPEMEHQIPDARFAIDLSDRLLEELSSIDGSLVWHGAAIHIPRIHDQIKDVLEAVEA